MLVMPHPLAIDGSDEDEELWVPATRHSPVTKIVAIVFGAIFVLALLGGGIFVVIMCLRCNSDAGQSRRGDRYSEDAY